MADKQNIKYSRDIQVVYYPDVDVMVCGIGCAGLTAAISAGRAGANTLAIERWPFAGGNTTAASVNGCCGLADMTTGKLAVGGIVTELLAEAGILVDRGIENDIVVEPKEILHHKSEKLFEPITDIEQIRKAHTRLPYAWDMEKFKRIADKLLLEANVKTLYHTQIIDVIVVGSKIEYVLISDRESVKAVKPKIVIDCTGDGNIAAWAGVPFEMSDNPQPATLVFYVANVNIPKDKQKLQDKCTEVFRQAYEKGQLDTFGGPYLSWPGANIVRFNAIRQKLNTLSTEALSSVEIHSRAQAWKMFELLKSQLEEFRNAQFLSSGSAIGIRESRRIKGKYTLTADDILQNRRFPDAIVKGAWNLDYHPSDKIGHHPQQAIPAYDIPYRTLLPVKIDNLLIAGRSHSATKEALASSRVGVTAMGMGQAAGTAGAIAAKENILPRDIDINKLRATLLKQNVIL